MGLEVTGDFVLGGKVGDSLFCRCVVLGWGGCYCWFFDVR